MCIYDVWQDKWKQNTEKVKSENKSNNRKISCLSRKYSNPARLIGNEKKAVCSIIAPFHLSPI